MSAPAGERVSLRRAARRAAWILVCAGLPLLALYFAVAPVALGDRDAVDFHYNYYLAAEAILEGEDFYPTDGFVVRGPDDLISDYVYPPLIALATIPWTVLPVTLASVLFQGALVAVLVSTLVLLGVRDWRCYGLAFLWPPATDAITTGNVSLVLGLAAAVVWRFRDRPLVTGSALGLGLAAKALLWPLTVWFVATRRLRAAVASFVVALVVLAATWAIVGFRGLLDYPGLVRRVSDRMDEHGYTLYALGVDVGVSPDVARAGWIAVAAALLGAMVVLGRRGDDRRAFVLAIAAAIAFSPIVWLHYLSLLLVVVAVVQPTFGWIWGLGVPLQLVVTTGVYNGSTTQTVAVLGVSAFVVGWSLRRREPRFVTVRPAAAARS